jgi:hypothetical protein
LGSPMPLAGEPIFGLMRGTERGLSPRLRFAPYIAARQ